MRRLAPHPWGKTCSPGHHFSPVHSSSAYLASSDVTSDQKWRCAPLTASRRAAVRPCGGVNSSLLTQPILRFVRPTFSPAVHQNEREVVGRRQTGPRGERLEKSVGQSVWSARGASDDRGFHALEAEELARRVRGLDEAVRV